LKSHETKVVAMALVVIALGSNIAPEHNLPRAMRSLKDMAGRPLRVSQVYETPPIGSPGAPWFLNAAVLLETSRALPGLRWFLNAAVLLETSRALPGLRMVLRRIEAQLGRIRTQDPNAPRTIDLDPVLWREEPEGPVQGFGRVRKSRPFWPAGWYLKVGSRQSAVGSRRSAGGNRRSRRRATVG